ncbi:MAG: NAD(P)H-dependent glycerol-3-phosphate dehydrogenase [Pseudomonadota bacterium]
MEHATTIVKSKNENHLSAIPFERVTVIGAGAWGTALATTARSAGRDVRIWGRSKTIVDDINTNRRNTRYLNDVPLAEGLVAMTDMAEACADTDLVLLVTPSTSIRDICQQLRDVLKVGVPLIVCAKGIEAESGLLMTQVVKEAIPGHEVGALSGPTFADETAKGFPTAVTIACEFDRADGRQPEETLSARVAVSLGTETFRPFMSDDVVGVEVGGAVKNVLAILCGIVTGAGFASNTRAALITRGLDEMKVLAEALGGRRETVTGLSGIGDLILTCSSLQSRNLSYGTQLGQHRPRDEIFDGKPVVVEGVANCASVVHLARAKGIEMPISEAVYAIVHEHADIGETFGNLWTRPLEAEPRALDIELEHPQGEGAAQHVADLMT